MIIAIAFVLVCFTSKFEALLNPRDSVAELLETLPLTAPSIIFLLVLKSSAFTFTTFPLNFPLMFWLSSLSSSTAPPPPPSSCNIPKEDDDDEDDEEEYKSYSEVVAYKRFGLHLRGGFHFCVTFTL